MADKKLAEPEKETNMSSVDVFGVQELEKKLKEFIMKYQIDIETLNRILSTYEDKIGIVEKQYYDLSFKFKQLQINLSSKQEEN